MVSSIINIDKRMMRSNLIVQLALLSETGLGYLGYLGHILSGSSESDLLHKISWSDSDFGLDHMH